jgi:hypothetical protein
MKVIMAAATMIASASAAVTIECDFYLYEEEFEANAVDVADFTWQPVFAWDSHNEEIDLCERLWLTDDDTVDGAVGSANFEQCCTPSDRSAMTDGCSNVQASMGWSDSALPESCDYSDADCGDVDTSFVGDWHVEYDACDFSYNCAETEMFDVVYRDTTPPVIGCEEDEYGDACEWGGETYLHEKCTYWEGLEITAMDYVSLDVDATFSVTMNGAVSEGTTSSTMGYIGNSEQWCSGGYEMSGETDNPTDYIDTDDTGTYCVEYMAVDDAGNWARPETFILIVVDATEPQLTLGDTEGSIECGVDTSIPDADAYCLNEPCSDVPEVLMEFCYSSEDSCDFDVNVDYSSEGEYTLTYSCDDTWNYVSDEYTLTVEDTMAPMITCPSDVEMHVYWTLDDYLTDAEASDYCDCSPVMADNRGTVVDQDDDGVTDTIGTYVVTFSATDDAGWETTCTSEVVVYDETEPVCDFVDCGDEQVYVEACTGSYVEEGIWCEDDYDEDIMSKTTTAGEVDVWELGTYMIYYDACDQSGNCADTVTRFVYVEDTTDPVLTAGYGMSYGDEDSDFYDATVVMEASDEGPYGIYDYCEDTCDDAPNQVETYTLSVSTMHWDDYESAAGYSEVYGALDIILDEQDYYCGSDSDGQDETAAAVESSGEYDALSNVCGMYYISWSCSDWAGNSDDAEMYVLTVDTIDPEIYYGSYFALAAESNSIALFVGGCALVTALVAIFVKSTQRRGYSPV